MPLFARVRDEDAIKSQKGFYIFGRDIREVPCLRSSILLGITCGTFAGLISFMFTSKAAMSSHIGFGSLWVVVFAYWIPCRHNYETNKKVQAHKAALRMREKVEVEENTPAAQHEEKENV